MEVYDNRKRVAAQIKSLATSKSVLINSAIDDYISVMHNNKARTGVLPSRKKNGENNPKHHVAQRYWVMFKKSVIPERKYKYHISESFFGNISDQASIRDRLGGFLGNRSDDAKHY